MPVSVGEAQHRRQQPSGSVWASASIVVGLIEMRIMGII